MYPAEATRPDAPDLYDKPGYRYRQRHEVAQPCCGSADGSLVVSGVLLPHADLRRYLRVQPTLSLP